MRQRSQVKYPIRWILVSTMIALVSGLVAILMTVQIYNNKRLLESESERRVRLMKNNLSLLGQSLSETISRQARNNIAEYNFSKLTDLLNDAVSKNSELTYAILIDKSRVVYIHTGNPAIRKSTLARPEDLYASRQTAYTTHEFTSNEQRYIEFINPIYFASEIWGHLRFGFSYAWLDREIRDSRREIQVRSRTMIVQSVGISLVFLLVGSLVIIRLAGKISDPLVTLSNAAQRLAVGDFEAARGIDYQPPNEVGLLAEAFQMMSRSLSDYSRNLEQKVDDRTRELSAALENLKATQHQLVEQEKMASLGGLVAGVAHEINTPVGIGITAASTFLDDLEKFREKYDADTMTRTDLDKFINSGTTSNTLILSNLQRASELVQAFKQVAIDQTSEKQRTFNLKHYLENVVISLNPRLKGQRHVIAIKGDDSIEITSYPGLISQIITNLILNSLIHGFEDCRDGRISIEFERQNKYLKLIYSDNGKGMESDVLANIFEPFFTTSRGSGGSGLGMHIVYNIVTQKLNGTIECDSAPGRGISFSMVMPIVDGIS